MPPLLFYFFVESLNSVLPNDILSNPNDEKKQGLPLIRLHDLRHSHISHLIHLGVNPVAIAHRAGHENVSITLNTYGHLYPDAEQEIMSKLNK